MSEFPWETKKREEKENHANNGYTVEMTHNGQKRAYGDTFVEYRVKSNKPENEVEGYCIGAVCKCSLTSSEYLADERAGVKDFGDHFRSHYKFSKTGEGEYFYQVIRPSTH